MPVADKWKCCHCGNLWSYELYAACLTCLHSNCIRCPSYSFHEKERTWRKSNLATPTQANAIHSGPQRTEKGTLSEDLGTFNNEPLQTFKSAERTTSNQDNQQANLTSSPGGRQAKSITLPIQRPPGAADTVLLHLQESEYGLQNSSSYANESHSGVKSVMDNDLFSRLELWQVNSRRHSKSSDFNSESHIKAITTSCETSRLGPPTPPKQLPSYSVQSIGAARSSTKIEQSLGYEGVEILESAASGTKHSSTIRVTDTKSDETQQDDGIPNFSKFFNAQLFEDHYQRFVRGFRGGAEELDGDDASSRNSSSEQDTSIAESLTLDPTNAKTNRKHRIGKTSKDQATDSEDDEIPRKNPLKRPRKTAEEKQAELRCTEFAAGRQTTAKCLTYSTRNLHRLKSDHLIADHKIAKPELDIGRRQHGETEASLWKRLFMKRNPEWLDSHLAVPSPYYSANYEPIQQFELYLRQQADHLRLPDSQPRIDQALPDIFGQDQVDYLPTRHFGAALDRPLGNTALSSTRPQLGRSGHPHWTDQNNLPSSHASSSTMPSSVDTSSSSYNSPSDNPKEDKICRCKTHTDTCDRLQFASGAEKCVSCQGYFSWTENAISYIVLTTEGESLCRCKWHDHACRKLQEEYDARKCASCKGWLAFSEQANKLIKIATEKVSTEPCKDRTEYSEFSEFFNLE